MRRQHAPVAVRAIAVSQSPIRRRPHSAAATSIIIANKNDRFFAANSSVSYLPADRLATAANSLGTKTFLEALVAP